MSQADLAKAVDGVTASNISKAERGIEELTPEQLKAVADAIGVAPESLLDAAAADAPSSEEASPDAREEAAPDAPVSLTAEEKELLELYKTASAGSRKAALFVLKSERQLIQKLMSALAGMMKKCENGENPFANMMSGSGDNPISGMMGGLKSIIGGIVGKVGDGENQDKQVSGSLLAFTYFYSVSIYILLLSFYFWQWRTDIKPEKQD